METINNFNAETTILEEIIYSHKVKAVLGSDLEVIARNSIRNGTPMEVARAERFLNRYFVANGTTRPIPTAYYNLYTRVIKYIEDDVVVEDTLVGNNNQIAISDVLIRRDNQLSPGKYDLAFAIGKNTLISDSIMFDVLTNIVCGTSLTGAEIRSVCLGTIARYKNLLENNNFIVHEDISNYPSYQIQVAQTVLDRYFSNPDKCPGDEVYYRILLPQIGSPRLKRDLTKSPRKTYTPDNGTD